MASIVSNFDDLVHQLLNAPRPKAGSEEQLKALVSSLVQSCVTTTGDSQNEKWKRVLLSLLYKRYHLLAPEAKAEAAHGGKKQDGESPAVTAAGDGERLIFYTAIQTMLKEATTAERATTTTNSVEQLVKAISVLCQLSPHVGGSRDVCKLMEIMATHLLSQEEQASGFLAKEKSESKKIAKATVLLKSTIESSVKTNPYSGLAWLLEYTTGQLGKDLGLVNSTANDGDKKELPSTLNVFVPHNKRGKSNKKGKTETSMRKIVNASLEVLVWSKSDIAMENPTFAKALTVFCDSKIIASSDKVPIKSALMSIQARIRKLRLQLNNFARDEGFMLTDLYVKDKTSVQVKHIRQAKSADLSKLTSLATKQRSTATLRLIQAHFASDPSKITKYDSITEIVQAFGSSKSDPASSEIEKMERQIQVARIGATIKHLRKICKESNDKNENRVIASVDRTSTTAGNLNHVAAVMVAAAMGEWPIDVENEKPLDVTVEEKKAEEEDECQCKLILGTLEMQIASFQNAVDLLDGLLGGELKIDVDGETIVGGEGTDGSVATAKTLMNLIERHVVMKTEEETAKPNANLLLFTSAGIRIPQDTQSAFTASGFRIHCHDTDGLGERLRREKATTGDITISLAWDSFDDLDLHAILPSKEEISYNKKMSANRNACLDVDMNAGGACSKEPVENIFLGNAEKKVEADHGSYTVFVQNYAYHTSNVGAEIPWRVVIDKNGKKENFVGKCKGSGESSEQIVCEFEYAGRTAPFPGEEKDFFSTANLVSLTTSTGQTLESVSQLLVVLKDLETLNEVRVLAEMDDDSDEAEEAFSGYESDSIDGSCDEDDGEETETARPTQANAGTLEVTSRDLLDMRLGKLPSRFHLAVSDAFGGVSLVEMCAQNLSRKLIAEKIPLKVLAEAGYPKEIVNAVKSKLALAASANRGER